MSRQNKVHPDHYTQAGRLTQDELARERQHQDESHLQGGGRRPRKAMPLWMSHMAPKASDEAHDTLEADETAAEIVAPNPAAKRVARKSAPQTAAAKKSTARKPTKSAPKKSAARQPAKTAAKGRSAKQHGGSSARVKKSTRTKAKLRRTATRKKR